MINIDTRGHIDFIIIYFQKQFYVSGCMRLNVDMQIESERGFKIVSILERILKVDSLLPGYKRCLCQFIPVDTLTHIF